MRLATSMGMSGLLVVAALSCSGSNKPAAAPEASEGEGASRAEPTASTEPTATSTTASGANQAALSTPQSDPGELDVPPYKASSNRIMQAHFKDALLIRRAIVSGKPEDAANPATVIVSAQSLEDLPSGWQPFVVDMQAVAQRIVNGTTAPAVAAAAADLALSCGACHSKFGGPPAAKEPAPSEDGTFNTSMRRHGWATERLWDALAVPSEPAWDAGATVLATTQFPEATFKSSGTDARAAAKDFIKLAARAGSKKKAPERAGLYAELLLTCGACHQAVQEPH